VSDADAESIGVATMQPDRTLVLQLHATDKSGARGDAQLVYPPSHPQYPQVLQHVGPIAPGESRPVKPWP
jgi:hypothetical protein